MNTKTLAALAAIIGMSAIGLASATSPIYFARPGIYAPVNAVANSTVNTITVSTSLSINASPMYSNFGWHYLAPADPTHWGVLSTNYYAWAQFNVSDNTYFLFR